MFKREINEFNRPGGCRQFMQLSFNYTFEYAGDEVFCCYTIPYTYTEM